MGYSFKRERVETNFLRPRYSAGEGEGSSLKGLINVTSNPGHICWGIVDAEDKFVAENQQMVYNPWTGEMLPENVEELKAEIRG